jgi:hypothetical protein
LRAPFTPADVAASLDGDPGGKLIEILSGECDQAYYDCGEPIADRLFEFIRAQRSALRLPPGRQ